MPRHEFSHFARRSRPEQPAADEHAPGSNADPREWPEHIERFKPAWWPENEPWPPMRRPHWSRARRGSFFRRIGCIFLLLNVIGAGFLVTVIVLVLNGLGLASINFPAAQRIVPVAGVMLAILVSAVILAGASLRRVSAPLDELLLASGRVADGDYSARVRVHGPTEVRSLGQAFNSMAEQLEIHDRQRRSMLADVTHELRTPLTIIQGNLEGILDGLYPADEGRLKSILEETQVLSRLTDDLRTLALAESGALQLKREQVDLLGLARDTVAAFRSQGESSGVDVEFTSVQNEIMLNIDPERIRQVLGNLISNALRYSPRGSKISVAASLQGSEAAVIVRDTGPGIAEADLPHIFDRYYKSADSRGMGLGLSIAKYIVEAHGGHITAESRPGIGTAIRFSLPV